jgi:hypothetical protein
MKNVIKTVLCEHQKGLPVYTETLDKSKVNFYPATYLFRYEEKIGSYYFHGTNIVLMYVNDKRQLNVMQLPNEFFKILN